MIKTIRQSNVHQEYHQELAHWIACADLRTLSVFAENTDNWSYRAWLQALPKRDVMSVAYQCLRNDTMDSWTFLVSCLSEENRPTPQDYHLLAVSNIKAELYPSFRALDWIRTPMSVTDQQYMLARWYHTWCNSQHIARKKSYSSTYFMSVEQRKLFANECIGMMTFLSDHPMNGIELFQAATAGGKRLGPANDVSIPPKTNSKDRHAWMQHHAPLVTTPSVSYANPHSAYGYIWGEILRHHPSAAECFFLMHELGWCSQESSFGDNTKLPIPVESIEEMRVANRSTNVNTHQEKPLWRYFQDSFYPCKKGSKSRGYAYDAFEKAQLDWPATEVSDRLRYLESLQQLINLQSHAMNAQEKWSIYQAVYPEFQSQSATCGKELDLFDLEWNP